MTPFRDPRVLPQLQGDPPSPTGGRDCNFRCVQGVIVWALGVEPTIASLRDDLGNPKGDDGKPRGISMTESKRLLTDYGLEARLVTDPADVRAALAAGYAVIAAINYGYLNAHPAEFPGLSGDRGFTGNHAVVFFGLEVVAKRFWSQMHDPLHDNRHAYVPKANVMVRRRQIEALMSAMAHGTQAVVVRLP